MQSYTKEFKQEAVRLVQTSEKPMSEITRELGIADSTFHHWCQQLKEHGTHALPGSGHQVPQDEELRQLKRDNERLRQERDILNKAIGIFSRGPL